MLLEMAYWLLREVMQQGQNSNWNRKVVSSCRKVWTVDRWAMPLTALLLPQQVAPALHSAVLSEAGFSSLQELQEEIEARKGCVIAQALPVVVRGIRDMLSRCARQDVRLGQRGHSEQVRGTHQDACKPLRCRCSQ